MENKISKLRGEICNKNEEIAKLKNKLSEIVLYNNSENSILNSIMNSCNENQINNNRQGQSLMISSNENQLLQEEFNNMANNLNKACEMEKKN